MSSLLLSTQNPVLCNTYYSSRSLIATAIASDGAIGVTATAENPGGGQFYIETQRYGADFIQAGLATGNTTGGVPFTTFGETIIDYGFSKQGSGGDFPGTGDPFHSTSLFVEAAARAILLFLETGGGVGASWVSTDSPKTLAAAQWLDSPTVKAAGIQSNAPYTHRCWLLAAALAQIGIAVGGSIGSPLITDAITFAEQGLTRQLSNGVNPERGGYDVSYQCLGELMACRYAYTLVPGSLLSSVLASIRAGLNWALPKVNLSTGAIDTSGSSRTGIEFSRGGDVKAPDYRSAGQAFLMASDLLGGVQSYINAGTAIMQGPVLSGST